jgi:rhodanese-related sulfurtransferase
VLVDVREAFEREAFHIGGVWIPLGELISRREEVLAQAESQPVVFYCRKGIRSAIAIQRLQGHYPEVAMYNLRGGIASISKDDFV